MAKSIRSKTMKKHRSFMRNTVGAAQLNKNLRQAVRRLGNTVAKQEAAAGAGDTAALPSSLSQWKTALTGIPVASASAASSLPGLKPIEGPPRTKKLRHSFNTLLRERRLETELEDLTDDEDDVRLADKRALSAPMVFAPSDLPEEDMGIHFVQESGVKKASDKAVPKRENSTKFADNFRDGSAGMYDTDPALTNPKRTSTHRKDTKARRGGLRTYTTLLPCMDGVADAAPRFESMFYKVLQQYKQHLITTRSIKLEHLVKPIGGSRGIVLPRRKRLPRHIAPNESEVDSPVATTTPSSAMWPCEPGSTVRVNRTRMYISGFGTGKNGTARFQSVTAHAVPFPGEVKRLNPPPMQSWSVVPTNVPGQDNLSLWYLPYVDDDADLRAELTKAEYQLKIRLDRRQMTAKTYRIAARLFSIACVVARFGCTRDVVASALIGLQARDDILVDEAFVQWISGGASGTVSEAAETTAAIRSSAERQLAAEIMQAVLTKVLTPVSTACSWPEAASPADALITVVCECFGQLSFEAGMGRPFPSRLYATVAAPIPLRLQSLLAQMYPASIIDPGKTQPEGLHRAGPDHTQQMDLIDLTSVSSGSRDTPVGPVHGFQPPTIPICKATLPYKSTFCRYCYTYGCSLHPSQPLTDPAHITRHFEVNQLPDAILSQIQKCGPKCMLTAIYKNHHTFFAKGKRRRTSADAKGTPEDDDESSSEMPLSSRHNAKRPGVKQPEEDGAASDLETMYRSIITRISKAVVPALIVRPLATDGTDAAFLFHMFLRCGGHCCLMSKLMGLACKAIAWMITDISSSGSATSFAGECGVSMLVPNDWMQTLRNTFENAEIIMGNPQLKSGDFLSRQSRLQSRLLNEKKSKWPGTRGTPIQACYHEGPCKGNPACSCNENCQPCTKFCGCAISCESRWWGCCCKTGCKRTSCPCLVANRECDPDACSDCHCAEALQLAFSPGADRRFTRTTVVQTGVPEFIPSHLVSTSASTAERCEWLRTTSDPSQARKARNALLSLPYYCSNSQLQSARKQRTRVAHSSIPAAGCGLFIDAEADVGDLIREYAGEAVTTAEADRRGVLYDMMNISYLFDMDDLTAVDATLLGNKIRFANHADKPNCACVVRISKGQHRIGIYAAKKLAAHEELFFNYGYRTKVAWQRDPSLARKPTVQSQRKPRSRRRSDSE